LRHSNEMDNNNSMGESIAYLLEGRQLVEKFQAP
jgi:hypothetical protein